MDAPERPSSPFGLGEPSGPFGVGVCRRKWIKKGRRQPSLTWDERRRQRALALYEAAELAKDGGQITVDFLAWRLEVQGLTYEGAATKHARKTLHALLLEGELPRDWVEPRELLGPNYWPRIELRGVVTPGLVQARGLLAVQFPLRCENFERNPTAEPWFHHLTFPVEWIRLTKQCFSEPVLSVGYRSELDLKEHQAGVEETLSGLGYTVRHFPAERT